MVFENLTDEELCDLMCGKPEDDDEQYTRGSEVELWQADQKKSLTQDNLVI